MTEKTAEDYCKGDKIRFNKEQREWRESFVGGKKIETITRVEQVGDEIYLWMENGHYVTPEMIEKL